MRDIVNMILYGFILLFVIHDWLNLNLWTNNFFLRFIILFQIRQQKVSIEIKICLLKFATNIFELTLLIKF